MGPYKYLRIDRGRPSPKAELWFAPKAELGRAPEAELWCTPKAELWRAPKAELRCHREVLEGFVVIRLPGLGTNPSPPEDLIFDGGQSYR